MPLKPFSHLPGRALLIPSTKHLVEAYPTLIRFGGKELHLDVEGPVKNFTIVQDLERVCVTIFSDLYRFHILPSLEVLETKQPHTPAYVHEELDFGAHKKQDWEGIKKRLDFQELFPIWFRLGSLLKLPKVDMGDEGMFRLLKDVQECIAAHRPEKILPAFQKLFLAGFSDMFVPRSEDDEHQGIVFGKSSVDPHYLLTEGAKLIRSLFVEVKEDGIALLPNCPPELFAGKMRLVETPFGLLNFEWSKKRLRKVEFFPSVSGKIRFYFPSDLQTFRLRHEKKERGKRISCSQTLEINSDTDYLLDQFQN